MMLYLTIKLIFFTTLWCVGIHVSGREPGDFFYFLNKWSKGTWLAKPLYHCVNCMASIHSLAVISLYFWARGFWIAFAWEWENVGRLVSLWVIVAVCCTATNGIVFLIHETLESIFYINASNIEEKEKKEEKDGTE